MVGRRNFLKNIIIFRPKCQESSFLYKSRNFFGSMTESDKGGLALHAELAQPVKDRLADKSSSEPSGETDAELERKFNLVASVGEECISKPELRNLLAKKGDSFVCYDGFEPSGRMHIAQGVFKRINVNKCTEAGGTFKFWVADWFALMNDKMGGDLEKIKDTGKYLIEVIKWSNIHRLYNPYRDLLILC